MSAGFDNYGVCCVPQHARGRDIPGCVENSPVLFVQAGAGRRRNPSAQYDHAGSALVQAGGQSEPYFPPLDRHEQLALIAVHPQNR